MDEEGSVLAYQLRGGVNLALTAQLEIYSGLRWRQTDDMQVAASLFPAEFELAADSLLAEIATRWQF
ncbi:hypothetical protein [Microbulbifer yueqingensis]|uniref:hypothetical protein n=1 Tax=Microbulbifer yueqingensis TaxID=658219 RepID=UPI0011142B64|nr:hypothetical protein [Microbulbifer yueqingensis]